MKNRKIARVTCLLWLLIGSIAGCTGVPSGTQAVSGFDLDRYLGKWYEIARLNHRFERGLTDVSATYTTREGGGVTVLNRGYDADKGRWEEALGKAFFVDEPDIGELKVSFFGPFYGGYNVLELDKANYSYALVAGPNRNYLWVLARTPQLDQEILAKLVATAESLGFPTEELIYVDQSASEKP